nr:FAD-dependent oxidoreductase [Cryobacterium roopkundense]
MKSVTIVGASLAGHASARALRAQGFDGRITMIGDEVHRPYDRPPLSKEFLTGRATLEDLALEADDEQLDVEWILGTRALSLDCPERLVTLSTGQSVRSDAVMIATGSVARRFDRMIDGVHTLRTVEDAVALRADLVPGARLVVAGSGFIGLEVASAARALGVDVTVLGSSQWPLSRTFGDTVAATVQRLQESRGVRVRNNVIVDAVLGTDRVTGVRLSTGEQIDADVVVLGIGSRPAVGWLGESGLDVRAGVVCDEFGATAAPGILAVGDCAAWFDPIRGRAHRIEHWTDSRDRPSISVARLLSGRTPRQGLRPSYLWSDQCGSRIQFAGRLLGGEELTIEAGGVETGDLLMVYRRGGNPVAAVGFNQTRLMAQWRKSLTVSAASVSPPATVPVAEPLSQPFGA